MLCRRDATQARRISDTQTDARLASFPPEGRAELRRSKAPAAAQQPPGWRATRRNHSTPGRKNLATFPGTFARNLQVRTGRVFAL